MVKILLTDVVNESLFLKKSKQQMLDQGILIEYVINEVPNKNEMVDGFFDVEYDFDKTLLIKKYGLSLEDIEDIEDGNEISVYIDDTYIHYVIISLSSQSNKYHILMNYPLAINLGDIDEFNEVFSSYLFIKNLLEEQYHSLSKKYKKTPFEQKNFKEKSDLYLIPPSLKGKHFITSSPIEDGLNYIGFLRDGKMVEI